MTFEFAATVAERGVEVAFTVAQVRRSRCWGPTAPASRPCSPSLPGCCARTRVGSSSTAARSRWSATASRRRGCAPHDRHIALLAQDPLLFPHLTVLDNVAFGTSQPGRSPIRGARDGARTGWSRSAFRTSPTASRPRSPAARLSESRSRAPWPPTPACCCSTSRWQHSTSPSLRRCGRPCAECSADRTVVLVTHDALDALLLADSVVVLEGGASSSRDPPPTCSPRRAAHSPHGSLASTC